MTMVDNPPSPKSKKRSSPMLNEQETECKKTKLTIISPRPYNLPARDSIKKIKYILSDTDDSEWEEQKIVKKNKKPNKCTNVRDSSISKTVKPSNVVR
jgi:hypothetical protein